MSELKRQIGLGNAVALNMINMVGIGPFITLPLVAAALGPQAMWGWILGAVIAVCDGLVWSELGATMPQAGGSYAFLREIYGPRSVGRLASFLYVWQLCFSAPLAVASGCLGLAQYAAYVFPSLREAVADHGPLAWIHRTNLLAAAACALIVVLLYRNVRAIARLAWFLFAGMMLTIGTVIVAGLTHFHSGLIFGAAGSTFHLNATFLHGLAAATLVTTYDYWGYYNVCFMGGEVREPGKTIPRAVLIGIGLVAVLYLLLNLSVMGVIPWQEMAASATGNGGLAIISVVLERTLGAAAGRVVALLIMWTAFASVFALLLAFSRVPYVAAHDGNFFAAFGKLHPKHAFPHRSLLALGAVATCFCFFNIGQIIAALVTIRIILQFLLQQVGVIVLRLREPQRARPFRVWLYPLPPLLALVGFCFVLVSRPNASHELLWGGTITFTGTAIFLVRSRLRQEWPFGSSASQSTMESSLP